ncbi:MAG: DUF2510 domain-containing protein [Coriobacteriia bacterium]|nr:DUF2510 domain-containing protein [Coriobacteriia bacterium]
MDDDIGPSWTDAVWRQNPMFESATVHSDTASGASSGTDSGRTPAPAGWCSDPLQRHPWRYWDGESWTEYVADNGQVASDPL